MTTMSATSEGRVANSDVESRPEQSHRQRQTRDLAIESLIKETHQDAERIRALYDAAHDQLASQAKIKTYLHVIATRLVRVQLLSDAHPQLQ